MLVLAEFTLVAKKLIFQKRKKTPKNSEEN